MTLDDINQQLAAIINSGDPTFAQAAQYIAQATQAAQSGQLSKDDLAQILADCQRQLSIINDESQLAYKNTLNTIITGIIAIAGIVY